MHIFETLQSTKYSIRVNANILISLIRCIFSRRSSVLNIAYYNESGSLYLNKDCYHGIYVYIQDNVTRKTSKMVYVFASLIEEALQSRRSRIQKRHFHFNIFQWDQFYVKCIYIPCNICEF